MSIITRNISRAPTTNNTSGKIAEKKKKKTLLIKARCGYNA